MHSINTQIKKYGLQPLISDRDDNTSIQWMYIFQKTVPWEWWQKSPSFGNKSILVIEQEEGVEYTNYKYPKESFLYKRKLINTFISEIRIAYETAIFSFLFCL